MCYYKQIVEVSQCQTLNHVWEQHVPIQSDDLESQRESEYPLMT